MLDHPIIDVALGLGAVLVRSAEPGGEVEGDGAPQWLLDYCPEKPGAIPWGLLMGTSLRGNVPGRGSGHQPRLLPRAIVRLTLLPSVMYFIY